MAAAVTYSLSIDGTPASQSLLGAIKTIEFEDHAEMADMLRLQVAVAVRDDARGWTVLDDNVFNRLANVKLDVTIGSGRSIPVANTYVIETDARLANDPSQSVLLVTAMDPTVLMHLEEKVKAWPNMTDSDVASAIFSDAAYGFTPVVESTNYTRQDTDQTLIQRGTDIQFLQDLAKLNGFECFVELNDASGMPEGHFHPPHLQDPPQGVLSVNMGSATNVNSFSARYDMLGPTTADAKTVDIDNASDQTGQAQTTSQTELGSDAAASADRPRKVLLSQLAMGKSGEVQKFAQAVVDKSSWAIVADGEVSTAAYGGVMRAKRPILVRGVGQQFSGTYYVERVLHTIKSDGTYVQRFTLRRNALGLKGGEPFQSQANLGGPS